jgi:hypothetical protein
MPRIELTDKLRQHKASIGMATSTAPNLAALRTANAPISTTM